MEEREIAVEQTGRRMRAPWVRLVRERGPAYPKVARPIRDADDVMRYVHAIAEGDEVEVFRVVLLNGKHAPLGVVEVTRGSINAALVHPREVFRTAIAMGATSIVLTHNHPSGDPTPSDEDRAITTRLRQAGDLVGIRVLDHVILGEGGRRFSMEKEGSW